MCRHVCRDAKGVAKCVCICVDMGANMNLFICVDMCMAGCVGICVDIRLGSCMEMFENVYVRMCMLDLAGLTSNTDTSLPEPVRTPAHTSKHMRVQKSVHACTDVDTHTWRYLYACLYTTYTPTARVRGERRLRGGGGVCGRKVRCLRQKSQIGNAMPGIAEAHDTQIHRPRAVAC